MNNKNKTLLLVSYTFLAISVLTRYTTQLNRTIYKNVSRLYNPSFQYFLDSIYRQVD